MPRGYVIARMGVRHPEALRTYVENSGPTIARHNGRVMIKGCPVGVVEGESYEIQVMVALPTYDDACAFYFDPVFQQIIEFRQACGENILILEEVVPAASAA